MSKETVFLASLAILIGTAMNFPREARADEHYRGPSVQHCVTAFFDADHYGWLSFKNRCTKAVYISYRCKEQSCSGSTSIRPGKKESTGHSRDEVAGGYRLAVCPEGYLPIDRNEDYWDGTSDDKYYCKKF